MGVEPGANPPVPRAMCPAPSQLHHAASSVVAPLEPYKAPWMLSAQTTQWAPSRDYSFLNEAARRRVQSTRCRRRRRRYTVLQQELHSLKGRGHRQSWHANQQRLGNHLMGTKRPAWWGAGGVIKDPSLLKIQLRDTWYSFSTMNTTSLLYARLWLQHLHPFTINLELPVQHPRCVFRYW